MNTQILLKESLQIPKFIILLIFLCLGAYSCNEGRIKELEIENQKLKEKIRELKEDINTKNQLKYYAFCVIKTNEPGGQTGYKQYIDWSERNIVSEIFTLSEVNNSVENYYIDHFENEYMNSRIHKFWPIKIIDRKFYFFNSYSDASIARRKYLNR